MNIRLHLFNSFLIHALVMVYLLSIPVHKGNMFSMKFGTYSVDLVSESKLPEKSSTGLKPPEFKVRKSVSKRELSVKKETAQTKDSTEKKETIEPSGISLTENRQTETIIKDEESAKKQKHEVEIETKKPAENKLVDEGPKETEPPKTEPVIKKNAPPEKPEPEKVKEEVPPLKEPQIINPADQKPSKVDKIEEPEKVELPVKADEKAQDVSPLTEKKTSETETPISKAMSKESAQVSKSEVAKAGSKREAKTDKEGFAGIKGKIRGQKKSVAGLHKTAKDTAQKDTARSSVDSAQKKDASPQAPSGAISKTLEGSAGPQADISHTGNGKTQTAEAAGSEAEKAKEAAPKKPPPGISVSEALFFRDIKIEVFLKGTDGSVFSSHLYRKTHPLNEGYGRPDQKAIALTEEPLNDGKKIFYVDKADKGIYTFVMTNKTDTPQQTDIMIRLFERKKGSRDRKFENIEIRPHTELKIKFILPEAVFWDDDSYFTGTIENSDSVTKFNNTTGLMWKEEN